MNIPITMDMVLEGEEQFVAVLRSKDSAVKLAQSTVLVTFLDADCTNSMLTVSIHIYTCILCSCDGWLLPASLFSDGGR